MSRRWQRRRRRRWRRRWRRRRWRCEKHETREGRRRARQRERCENRWFAAYSHHCCLRSRWRSSSRACVAAAPRFTTIRISSWLLCPAAPSSGWRETLLLVRMLLVLRLLIVDLFVVVRQLRHALKSKRAGSFLLVVSSWCHLRPCRTVAAASTRRPVVVINVDGLQACRFVSSR